MKVLWITNVPSPYRVDFFNKLGVECELTVLFEKATSEERDVSWRKYKFSKFNGILMKGVSTGVDNALCIEVIKYLKRDKYDIVVISNMSTPTGILAIQHMIIRNIPFVIEGDGGFAKNSKGIKEWLKTYLIKNSIACFSTGKQHDKYYLAYGAKKENIIRYPFTSLLESEVLKERINKGLKEDIKQKLEIQEERVILSVGRFIYQKGFDILLNASALIPKEYGVYIVGGVPNEEYLELIKKNNLSNVHFIDFKSKEELRKYYNAADLFVLPTRGDVWGLVINEAMAWGLPVITTDKCIAGLELIEDYKNGLIVPVDEINILAEKITELLNNDNILAEMSANNLSKIKQYTIERMVDIHINHFYELIQRKV